MEPGSAGEQQTGGHQSPSEPGVVSVPLEMAFSPFPALASLSEGALCWNKDPGESRAPQRAEGRR